MPKPNLWSSISTVKDVDSKLPTAVKSAARTLRVIEFFVEVRRRARANEIADRLGLPQSSASALLNSMVRLGYLDFDYATHTYEPTLRVAMLGAWLTDGPFRDGSMLSTIDRLADETGYAVSLSTRSDIHVRYIYTIQSRDPTVARITLAIRRYAAWSASGFVLLAGKPQAFVKALIRKTRAEDETCTRLIDSAQVLKRLEEATNQGYSFSRGLVTAGAGSIAMRLPSSLTGNREEIALSVAGDLQKLTNAETEVVMLMREAIAALKAKHAR